MAVPKDQPNSRRIYLRTGVWVMFILATITLGEFIVGVIAPPWRSLLLIIAAFKAFYVIKDYMHIGRLFNPEGEGH